jgi:hypothetical protein
MQLSLVLYDEKVPPGRVFHYGNTISLSASVHDKTGIADQGPRAHCPGQPVVAFSGQTGLAD